MALCIITYVLKLACQVLKTKQNKTKQTAQIPLKVLVNEYGITPHLIRLSSMYLNIILYKKKHPNRCYIVGLTCGPMPNPVIYHNPMIKIHTTSIIEK